MKLLSIATAAALLAMASASFAQYTQPGSSAGATTSRCDSLIGTEKERCLREEGSAGAGGTVSGSATSGSSTPSVTPSDTPSVTPSATPSVTPSATPSVTPSATPSVTVGGLSRCENLLGTEKDKCLQDERAGTGSTSGRAAGAGGSHAPGSTGTGAGTMGPQNTAPSGTLR
jgi:hypothetical protein